MKRIKIIYIGLAATFLFSTGIVNAQIQNPSKEKSQKEMGMQPSQDKQMDKSHKLMKPDELTWKDGPSTLPVGTQIAVLNGDPSKEGMFTIRLKIPANFEIPAHWHSQDENLVVISGEFMVGMGEKVDRVNTNKMPVGSYIYLPAKMHHFAVTKQETIIQLTGQGPFDINYINPSDDPRNKAVK